MSQYLWPKTSDTSKQKVGSTLLFACTALGAATPLRCRLAFSSTVYLCLHLWSVQLCPFMVFVVLPHITQAGTVPSSDDMLPPPAMAIDRIIFDESLSFPYEKSAFPIFLRKGYRPNFSSPSELLAALAPPAERIKLWI